MSFLLDDRLLTLTTSRKLDLAYTEAGLDISMTQLHQEADRTLHGENAGSSAIETGTEAEKILLTPSAGKSIADVVELPELEEHIHRAVKQVEKALRAKREWEEEKAELDSVNKDVERKR